MKASSPQRLNTILLSLVFKTCAMKYKAVIFIFLSITWFRGVAQDTFSILAFDSITGEVGGAGASCVNLYATPFSNDFIIELFPGKGAVACQASFIPGNQTNARNRFNANDSPTQLINWLIANDIAGNPHVRQYGVVRMGTGYPQAAAFTGSNCTNYKNHIVGPNYTIHGNILSGKHVLDSMEARFKREKGDLACKLMSAMQGANTVGADSRCAPYGTSSLFAFLKVSLPTDSFGSPSFLVSLRTHPSDSLEPIDSLQVLFDSLKSCVINTTGIEKIDLSRRLQLFPNPATEDFNVQTGSQDCMVNIMDITGRLVLKESFDFEISIDSGDLKAGIYMLEVKYPGSKSITRKLIIDH
jgi:uncharacterized Ntn-hydrolase superfamily protein